MDAAVAGLAGVAIGGLISGGFSLLQERGRAKREVQVHWFDERLSLYIEVSRRALEFNRADIESRDWGSASERMQEIYEILYLIASSAVLETMREFLVRGDEDEGYLDRWHALQDVMREDLKIERIKGDRLG